MYNTFSIDEILAVLHSTSYIALIVIILRNTTILFVTCYIHPPHSHPQVVPTRKRI